MSDPFSGHSESLPSEDQRAINEYFASAAYQRASRRPKFGVVSPPRVAVSWLQDSLPSLEDAPSSSSRLSFMMGLVGLNAILLLFSVLSPVAIHFAERWVSPSSQFFLMMVFVQTVMFPPIISFSFATVTPMFWYGSVLLRFAVGMLLVVPGCITFGVTITTLENGPDDFWFAFFGVMFSQFLVAGTVALLVQMWSPWTLTHARPSGTPLPPLGTLAMMELTGVAAVGCAVFIWDGFAEILEGILFFAAIGALSSVAVIAVLIAFLRERRRNWVSGFVAAAGSLGTASLMCGFFAVEQYGWNSIGQNLLYLIMTSLYGAVVICAVMGLCLSWLKICGWKCVNRFQKKPGADIAPVP